MDRLQDDLKSLRITKPTPPGGLLWRVIRAAGIWWVMCLIGALVFWGTVAFVAFHFIHKFW